MRYTAFLILLFVISNLNAQTGPDKYWVQFTDKVNSPYSIDQPEEFLSYRAIDRRNRYNIAIIEQDKPVNPEYVQAVFDFGVNIIHSSKWFNGISIQTDNSALLDSIRALPFVAQIKTVKTLQSSYPDIKLEKLGKLAGYMNSGGTDTTFFDYGFASEQTGMIKGHILHNQGFHGQGMIIAVLDGGFTNVNTNPAFDSLWHNNQILDHWDFVKGTPLSFNSHNHGGQVLSLMGANMPGSFVGTAPKASYILLRTEDGASEFRIEEDNWVAGAEFADSAGVDLINSSLGYTTFDDTSMNYTYRDMDGNTTRITRAADIAASKGILVVTSASNEGAREWHYIGAPADGDSVFSIGAVDAQGVYASFSSTGPTYDGRIKPNVCAQGSGAAVSGSQGTVFFGNGTSYSSPIICGMTACLWQSNKSLNNMQIIEIIEQSSSQSTQPDSLLGYGIPDYSKAFFGAQGIDTSAAGSENIIRSFPNPFTSYLNIDYYAPTPQEFEIRIIDLLGKIVYARTIDPGYINFHRIRLSDLTDLKAGTYLLRIITKDGFQSSRIIKQTQ